MINLKTLWKPCAIIFGILIPSALFAQPEVMAWGNITGIRVDGQLMEFESSLRIVEKGWMNYSATGKEKQQPKYDRDGLKQIITNRHERIPVLRNCGGIRKGTCIGNLKSNCRIQIHLSKGVFFCIELPGKYYSDSKIKFIKGSPATRSRVNLSDISAENAVKPFKVKAEGMVITSVTKTA